MNQQTYYQKNIMIVDDDPDIVNDLQELFKSHGFQVITADNARNCILELEKGFQGIIILDLMMPVMNGIDTIKKMMIDGFINQNTIIVLTSQHIQGDEFDEIYPYIYDSIAKPFDPKALLYTIKKIAEQSPPKKRV
jgi:DNA-binding NtrC family response regulator